MVREGLNVVGWYLEEREDGRGMRIVLVQPTDDAGEDVEHVAQTPEELWAAFEAIAADPDLPEAEIIQNGEVQQQAAGDDIRGLAIDAAESFVTSAAGPFVGRLAGGAMRNPGRALEFLRSISRKDRR